MLDRPKIKSVLILSKIQNDGPDHDGLKDGLRDEAHEEEARAIRVFILWGNSINSPSTKWCVSLCPPNFFFFL